MKAQYDNSLTSDTPLLTRKMVLYIVYFFTFWQLLYDFNKDCKQIVLPFPLKAPPSAPHCPGGADLPPAPVGLAAPGQSWPAAAAPPLALGVLGRCDKSLSGPCSQCSTCTCALLLCHNASVHREQGSSAWWCFPCPEAFPRAVCAGGCVPCIPSGLLWANCCIWLRSSWDGIRAEPWPQLRPKTLQCFSAGHEFLYPQGWGRGSALPCCAWRAWWWRGHSTACAWLRDRYICQKRLRSDEQQGKPFIKHPARGLQHAGGNLAVVFAASWLEP